VKLYSTQLSLNWWFLLTGSVRAWGNYGLLSRCLAICVTLRTNLICSRFRIREINSNYEQEQRYLYSAINSHWWRNPWYGLNKPSHCGVYWIYIKSCRLIATNFSNYYRSGWCGFWSNEKTRWWRRTDKAIKRK
jgi:hypothetical protein